MSSTSPTDADHSTSSSSSSSIIQALKAENHQLRQELEKEKKERLADREQHLEELSLLQSKAMELGKRAVQTSVKRWEDTVEAIHAERESNNRELEIYKESREYFYKIEVEQLKREIEHLRGVVEGLLKQQALNAGELCNTADRLSNIIEAKHDYF